MKKKRILFVFGTRPEAIKMAPVIEIARKTKGLDSVVCVTAQHRYLLDQALREFNIKPDIDLDLMRPNQTLQDITSRALKGLQETYRAVKPDLVLVQGDTTTVLASSLAAHYENVDIGHVEAGLRSGDIRNPFPEEINRCFVSRIAKYNFCPTKTAKNNLLKENVNPQNIFITGNTVIDVLKKTLKEVEKHAPVIKGIRPEFVEKPYALITGHRRENFGKGMRDVSMTIKSLAKKHPGFNWLWAVHLNPNARKVVFKTLKDLANVKLAEPPRYREFVYLMNRSNFIISDSGGIQEEAPTLGKKVFVTRVKTERPEAIESGTSTLVGTSPEKIQKQVNRILKEKTSGRKNTRNPFGDGRAAKRIIDVILKGSCKEFR